MVSPTEVTAAPRRSNGNHTTTNYHRAMPLLRQAQTAFIGVTLVSLAVAVVIAAIWHNALANHWEHRQAQALANQALERLNTHNMTTSSSPLQQSADENTAEPMRSPTKNETMVVVDATGGSTKVVVTSPSRNWTYHSDISIRPVVTCESTLILVRHCEDLGDPNGTDWNDTSKHCSELGYRHANYLASLFDNDDDPSSPQPPRRWPRPVRLYGLRRAANQRQYETLEPLAQQSGVNITMIDFATEGGSALVREWFTELQQQSSSVCGGQVAVAAWKHAYIPNLAHQLGCGPNQGCPVTAWNDYDFDSAWQLRYVRFASLEKTDQKLSAKQQPDFSNSDSVWHVYGTVTQQGFDPLAFRKRSL